MHLSKIVFCCLVFIQTASGQTATYSGADVPASSQFLIVGKVGPNFMVLTSTGWRKKLLVYDANMKALSSNVQKYMPDDLLGITPIPVGEHVIVTYRYQKKNIIYCDAVKLDAFGKRVSNVERIDSTVSHQEASPSGVPATLHSSPVLVTGNSNTYDPVSGTNDVVFGPYRMGDTRDTDNYPSLRRVIDCYSVINSEDKSKILVYKTIKTDREYSLVAKIIDHNLQRLDVFKMPLDFSLENYSQLLIDNEGNIFFLTQTTSAKNGITKSLQIFSKTFGVNNYVRVPVDLQDPGMMRPHLKIDNLNRSLVINSFYLDSLSENQPAGIFIFRMTTKLENMRSVYRKLPPALSSLRGKLILQKTGIERTQGFVDFFFIHDIYFKKDGSYHLVAGRTINTNDFSVDSANIRSLQPEIVFINIDSGLDIISNNVFSRKDMVEHPGLLSSYSFDVLNQGSSLHLMINAQTMNNISVTNGYNISQDNKVLKYPSQRQRAGYSLLPQKLVQVGLKELMMPFQSMKRNIGFALIQLEG